MKQNLVVFMALNFSWTALKFYKHSTVTLKIKRSGLTTLMRIFPYDLRITRLVSKITFQMKPFRAFLQRT